MNTSLLRLGVAAVQRLSTELASHVAERLFFTPPRAPLTPEVQAFLRTGVRSEVRVEEGKVVVWRWGHGRRPVVYLLHGWGGRGGRLYAFARPLLAAGCSVVTFDAPGHGHSSGRRSSMPQFARALQAVVAVHGPVHGIVAHSMGASATALAIAQGLPVRRAVFLGPAADPGAFARAFASLFGFTRDAMARMRRRTERRLRFRWDQLSVPAMARELRAAPPLLVVHDREDAIVAWAEGAAIAGAWPGAELVTTNGLGHRGVVKDPAIVAQAVTFLTGAASAPASLDTRDEAALLEHELFNRETRSLQSWP
jgi:pimeloyl-ACP methyl ester carboxylesterase